MAKEFNLTEQNFQTIKKLVIEHTGICLSDAKHDMVYSRLAKRLRQLDLTSFSEYLTLLTADDGDEIGNFINSVTTNLTSFFREQHHFDFLKENLIPRLLQDNADTRVIRVWSAGCSTGEEPYSLAMTFKECVPENQGWDVRILATDLDTNVLATGSAGVYMADRVNGIPQDKLKRWFYKGKGDLEGKVKVSSELRDMIVFKQLNLMGKWPVKPGVDIIFCRNVVIYFDKETQKVLFDRYANTLKSGGYLFIGHSETLYKVSTRFNLLGKTIYQRSE